MPLCPVTKPLFYPVEQESQYRVQSDSSGVNQGSTLLEELWNLNQSFIGHNNKDGLLLDKDREGKLEKQGAIPGSCWLHGTLHCRVSPVRD